ncbi:nitroreductase family protein [Thermodesulfobacteriota bacterium]
MNIDETIRGRRSIRKYQDKDIPDPVINEILELALYSPSSMNGQPWHFIIIRDPFTKQELANIKNAFCPLEKQAYQADFLITAPVVIIVCVDREKSFDRGLENAVLATENIMLGAYSRGLGSVYMSAYKAGDQGVAEAIKKLFRIPGNMDPVTIIPLGYPDETPEPKTIKPLSEVVFYEYFNNR